MQRGWVYVGAEDSHKVTEEQIKNMSGKQVKDMCICMYVRVCVRVCMYVSM